MAPPSADRSLTYLDAIRVPLAVQRIICLSPFCRRDNRLVTSAAITIYAWLYIITYLVVVALSSVLTRADEFAWHATFRSGGYLWAIISTFEVLFALTTQPMMLVYSQLKRAEQMNTMMQIDVLDVRLRRVFAVDLNGFYTGFVRVQNAQLFAWLLYVAIMCTIENALMSRYGFDSTGVMLFAIAYQMEQCTTAVLAWSITNTVKVLRSKFVTLRTVHGRLMLAADAGEFAGAEGALQLKRQLAELMRMFKELCDIIDRMSESVGALFVMRYAHDFTLVASQCYLVYWLLTENGGDLGADVWPLLTGVLLWMWQSVARIGSTALWTSWTVDEVCRGFYGVRLMHKGVPVYIVFYSEGD